MDATQPQSLIWGELETPIGTAVLVTDELGTLRAFNWTDYAGKLEGWLSRRYPGIEVRAGAVPTSHARAFDSYFGGDLNALTAIPWQACGTEFQQQVWRTLCEIPPGETWSYARLAQRVGRPTAMRAVGLANGANPVALVSPCHRVIGASGALTGYGGGLHRKLWLLTHEGARFNSPGAA